MSETATAVSDRELAERAAAVAEELRDQARDSLRLIAAYRRTFRTVDDLLSDARAAGYRAVAIVDVRAALASMLEALDGVPPHEAAYAAWHARRRDEGLPTIMDTKEAAVTAASGFDHNSR